jgi:hypothetical protein
VLWFYGCGGGTVIKPLPYNDPNEQMYVKLTDGDNVSGKVNYPYMSEVTEEEWHEWNIDLAFFDACGVDLSNVKKITIGIDGDGTHGDDPEAEPNIVYIEDIQLYATRCALVERSAGFTALDYAPGGAPAGDCVIDYQEIEGMARAWLDGDMVIATKNPGEDGLVVYFPLNEGDGNKVYSHPDLDTPDYCDTKWTGTFWNNGGTPGYYGTAWGGAGAPTGGSGCVYLSGEQGGRIQCGTKFGDLRLGIGTGKVYPDDVNAITLSIWAKWLGLRTWDGYLLSKGEGLMGKRGGYSENKMIWTFWESEGNPGGFGFGHYASGDTLTPDLVTDAGILNPFIGQWVHLAATFPHPSGDPADPNSHAKLYLNGGEVADGPWRFSQGDDPNIFLTIGQTSDQNAWPDSPTTWYGYLDEVRIYKRVLEPNEIGYLADTTPEDGELWVPIPSPANVYDGNEIPPYQGMQPKGQRVVNFKDFAVLVNRWLTEEMFPPSHRL